MCKTNRRSSMNQSMKAGAIPSLSHIRKHSKCLLCFLFIDNLNTVRGAKSPNIIHSSQQKACLRRILHLLYSSNRKLKRYSQFLIQEQKYKTKLMPDPSISFVVKHFPCMAPSSSSEIIGSILKKRGMCLKSLV